MNRLKKFNRRLNGIKVVGPFKMRTSDSIRRTAFRAFRRASKSRLIQVFGMRRTGNHAIIRWMRDGLPGSNYFCNDLGASERPENASVKEFRIGIGEVSMVASYEDLHPDEIPPDRTNTFFGVAEKHYKILILRDPYNLMASRFAWKKIDGKWFREDKAYRSSIIDLWKRHAKLFLEWNGSKTPDEGEIIVPVSYNRWVTDGAYRRDLAGQLNIRAFDSSLEVVPDFGGGSTFEGTEKRAGSDRYLRRFEAVMDEPDYRSIFRDEELNSLSDSLFGEIPGTERLIE